MIQGPLIRDDQGPSVSADAPQEVPVVDVGLSQGSAQGHERMFEFSPPESLPPEQGHQSASNQVMWFARIGEFVQRESLKLEPAMNPLMEARTQRAPTQALRTPSPRTSRLLRRKLEQTMTQWTRRAPYLYTPEQRAHEESSSASLTQEQILAEVQKQARMEMKVHHEERQALTLENRQLKAGESVGTGADPRAGRRGRDEWRGNPRGPQGSVPEELSDGRGGNPGGLRQPAAEAAGDPSKAQPAPGLRAPLGSEGDDPRRGQGSAWQPGRDPLGACPPTKGKSSGQGGAGVREHGPAGGDSSRPPVQPATSTGHAGQAAQVLQDPLGALVQGMAQCRVRCRTSLSSHSREPEVVKPGLADLPKLAEMGPNSAIDIGDWCMGSRITWAT